VKKLNLQHGDVLLERISKLPEGTTNVNRKNGLLVVMDGELTGHSHTITQENARLMELTKDGKSDLYLEVTNEPVTITHEEHKPIAIPPGIYKIGRVLEYDYLTEMERQVQD
jgi:hypothetical protein